MQLGRLEEIDQSQINHIEKIGKVQEVDEHAKVNPDDQYKNQRPLDQEIGKNEIILDNVKFGYDKDTKEFFVRIEKSGMSYQFPTEEIIKLKAKLKEILNEHIEG
jgi:uncharacterized FlaG/YvyC family protein